MDGSLVTTDSQKSAEKCCFNSNSLTKPKQSKFHVTEKKIYTTRREFICIFSDQESNSKQADKNGIRIRAPGAKLQLFLSCDADLTILTGKRQFFQLHLFSLICPVRR